MKAEIEEITRLTSKINEQLGSLENSLINGGPSQTIPPFERKQIIDKAVEEIDLFQKTTLLELRKAFE